MADNAALEVRKAAWQAYLVAKKALRDAWEAHALWEKHGARIKEIEAWPVEGQQDSWRKTAALKEATKPFDECEDFKPLVEAVKAALA